MTPTQAGAWQRRHAQWWIPDEAVDEELEGFLHLWCLNRGVLLTPFHNMALFSPQHTEADVDRHTQVFTAALTALTA